MTSQEALERLKQGNNRFIDGILQRPNLDAEWRRKTAVEGQNPFACVLTCSDSRVPVEHVFDTGVGDLFEIQVAGNVCGVIETGSIEFAVWELETPVIVVLGHTKCGGVTASVKGITVTGPLKTLVDRIQPSTLTAMAMHPDYDEPMLIDETTRLNVFRSMEDMMLGSAVIRKALREGKTQLHGAIYDIETGVVEWLGQHDRQAEWVALG